MPDQDQSETARKKAEADFHSNREYDRLRMSEDDFLAKYPNKKIYAIDRGPKNSLKKWLSKECPNSIALDYCCGLGKTSLQMAEMGATVYGIDIAPGEIETARNSAETAGLVDQVTFEVMDAEAMTFEDDMFDVIVCTGVLHHLDLDAAFPELARVLKPDGKLIAVEALGYNPIINMYRRRTPALRTAWETDHILTKEQVEQGSRFFNAVEVQYFHLLTILAIPLQSYRVFEPVLGVLERIDRALLRIPGLRLMAWQMIFVYTGKP